MCIRDRRLFDATNTPPTPGLSLFDQLREGVIAYLRYYEENPNVAWAAHAGIGVSDPVLRGIEDSDNDRQAERIVTGLGGDQLDAKVERDLRVVVYGWLAFILEMCRQRMLDPSIEIDTVADACAHALLDAVVRVPAIPEELVEFITAARP